MAGDRASLDAARWAEARRDEVLAAIASLDAETAAFEDRLQARLAQRFGQLRDRLLLSSGQTLQALDRALEATRGRDQRLPLMADAIRVRRQLAGLMDDDHGDDSDTRDPQATLVEMPAGPSAKGASALPAETLSYGPVPAGWRPAAAAGTRARASETIEERIDATLVVAEAEAVRVRPVPRVPVKPPQAAAKTALHRDGSRGGLFAAALFTLLGVLVVRGALIGPWLGNVEVKPEAVRRPTAPAIPEVIQKVPPRSADDPAPLTPTPPDVRRAEPVPARPPIPAPDPGPRRVDAPPTVPPPVSLPPSVKDAPEAPVDPPLPTLPREAPAITLGRFFQTQPTIRDVAKASTGGSCGPWDAPCAKARVLDCKLEYTLTPAVPVPGQPVRIQVTAVNTGEKTFKVQSLVAVVSVNGEQAPHPIVIVAKDLARGERRVIGQVDDVWKAATNSWWLEATVKDQKGDSYRAQFTWELKTPAF